MQNTVVEGFREELQKNLMIATSPWDGSPHPFQTEIWDTKRDILLDTKQRDSLSQIYRDIAIANKISHLWNDNGTRSRYLEDSYKELCQDIAEKLNAALQ